MELRLATTQDLGQLKIVYEEIIEQMNRQGISIWNAYFPYPFFAGDIQAQRLYLLMEQEVIAAAFALLEENEGAEAVKWPSGQAKALYLDRVGVNVHYQRRGVGKQVISLAQTLAKEQGASCLRLFVVDVNAPAIRLYQQSGFVKADGVYEEHLENGVVLREFGYEI